MSRLDFLLFCQRNPKPCPLIEVLEPGRFELRCAPGADVRTDLPGYRVFTGGVLTEEVSGIADLAVPDFGDAVEIMDDEVPVFWACGVTPQYVAELSATPYCISHAPGKMLVTDRPSAEA